MLAAIEVMVMTWPVCGGHPGSDRADSRRSWI